MFGSQDLTDDDPQVIDDLVSQTNAPADIKNAVVPVQQPPKSTPLNPTRIQANTNIFSGGALPQMLLSEDLNRNICRVRVYSSATTPGFNDYVIINDEKGKISNGTAGINIVARHNQLIDLDGHTGAVYATPGLGITASIEASAYGITHYDTPYSPE